MTTPAPNLSFPYAGAGAPALQGLDFAVEPGEIFGFLGPSGAGKSTPSATPPRFSTSGGAPRGRWIQFAGSFPSSGTQRRT